MPVAGVVVRLDGVPEGATGETPRDVDVSALPGATLLLSRAWSWDAGHLDIACAGGNTALWIDGLETVVLDAASAAVRKQLSLANLSPAAIERDGHVCKQRFVSVGGDNVSGQHLLGFHDGDAIVCTATCTDCDVSLSFVGALDPPPDGIVATATRHPIAMTGTLVLVAIALVTYVLRRRPRPAW